MAQAPSRVRVVRDDGTVIHLELAYVGRAADGQHVWESTTVVAPLPGDRLEVDRFPAQSTIRVRES